MSRFQETTPEEELIKLRRKHDNQEKINKELSDYVSILKKNVDENKKKIGPLQEENTTLTRSLIEKNDKIQTLESQIASLLTEDKIKATMIQELNEKLNKYKEIFQFVTQKTKSVRKRPQDGMNENMNYSVPYDISKKYVTDNFSFTDLDNFSPPLMPRAYSSIITKNCETNKPDFSRKSIAKSGSNEFIRNHSKIQEFQKEIEQFYSFDKKKSGMQGVFLYKKKCSFVKRKEFSKILCQISKNRKRKY